MALNLNTNPYFDDFDATKKYARILFKPGVAVQARELTQLQTILQNSLSTFSDHVFTDGAPVVGARGVIKRRQFVKIDDLDASASSVSNDTLINYIGDTVTGGTSGIVAVIDKVETGLDSEAVDKKTLYVSYIGGDTTGANLQFASGETLTVSSDDVGRNGDTFVVDTNVDLVDPTQNYFGEGLFFTIEDGIIYANNNFILHDNQEILLEKYKTTANFYVGIKVKDSVVTADGDTTLNDPATGTFNFNAPGADRYKITTEIAKLGLTATNDSEFVSMYKVEDGVITTSIQDDLDLYRVLGDKLAQKTFDESGHYVIKQFNIGVREHLNTGSNNGYLTLADGGDADKVAVTVGDGTAVVHGRKRSFLGKSHLEIDKGIETVIEEGFTTSTSYGNYVVVKEVCGNWALASGDIIELYGTATGAVTAGTFSNASPSGSQLGQARVRQVRWQSGTPGTATAEYRLYLYDIRMYGGSFADVRTIYYNDATADGFADCVLVSGSAVLQETSFNKLVFNSPIKASKTFAVDIGSTYDNNYTYQKEFTATVATNGTATITVTGTETFPYSTTPTQTQLDTEFVFVLQSNCTIDGTPYIAGEIFDLQTSNITSAGASAINFDLGTTVSVATNVKLFVKVRQTDVAPVAFNALKSRFVTIDTSTNEAGTNGPWNLGVPNIYKIENIYVTDSSGSYISTGTDYARDFYLDSGQLDNFYGHSKLIKRTNANISTANKKITIKFSYLEPNYSSSNGTYFAIDSYPVDDTGASGIYTYEIPVYKSKILGEVFDLRDAIDFRPFVVKTAADATSLGSATENPLETFELDTSGSYEFPIPTETYTTDAEYYLGRIDKIVLSEKGILSTVQGNYSTVPSEPIAPPETMVLASVRIPPYPSLSPFVAKANNRRDLQCQIRLRQNRRYTMQDIGAIEKRIDRLEYYTALSFMEMDTRDKVITDAAGNDRFKNGFFVEKFTDLNLSNTGNVDLNFAINPHAKYASNNFFEENADLIYDSINSTNVARTGNLITLPYSHASYTKNVSASKFRNCVGDLLFNYRGDMQIIPPSDNYAQIEDGGERVIENNYMADALENFANQLGQVGIEGNSQLTLGMVEFSDPVDIGSSGIVDVNTNFTSSTSGRARARTNITNQSGSGEITVDSSLSLGQNELSLLKDELSISTGAQGTAIDTFGGVLTDVSLAKFIRQQTIVVKATRLKPNTRFYPFFEGDNVSSRCKPIPLATYEAVEASGIDNFWSALNYTGSDWGDTVVSDSAGNVIIQFKIPGETYPIGSRQFRLVDDQFNRDNFITSSADASFDAFGLTAVSTDLVLSTQIPNINVDMVEADPDVIGGIVTDVVIEDFTITGNVNVGANVSTVWQDPLAQTFIVGETTGVFITKVDLYFRSKSSTNGVTIQIRDTKNGYPGKQVLPYASKFLKPSEVNISSTAGDGTVTFNATTVTFDSPVYLKPGGEYAIVILPQGNDPSYEAWVSKLGENKVGTTERILASDTAMGVLFSSSNNHTWTSYQDEDLKFELYRANFTSTSGSLKLYNGDIDYCKLVGFTNGFVETGDQVFALDVAKDNTGSGYVADEIITLNSFGNGTGAKIKVLTEISGAIDTFEIYEWGSGYDSDGADVGQSSTTGVGSGATFDITVKTGIVELFSSFYNVARVRETKENFAVSDAISNGTTVATIDELQNKIFNKIQHNIGEITFPKTNISHAYAGTPSTGVSTKGTTFYNLTRGVNTTTPVEYAVYSKANEVATLSSNKSLNITATLTTEDSKISPVVDLSRCAMIMTRNDINNDTTNENGIKGGNARAKYITKTVNLSDGQEAEDMQVFLDALKPLNSEISVYGKFLSEEDDADLENELYWIPMELVETPKDNGLTQTSFVEFNYKIPAKGSSPDSGLNGSGVFEYDVYRVGSATVTAGGSGYTAPPIVTFSGGASDKQAKGYAQISAGVVTNIVITDPGRYTTASVPTVTLTGGGGTGATATSATPALTTFSTIKSFAVKVVFTAENTSKNPKIKNLRAIALQA